MEACEQIMSRGDADFTLCHCHRDAMSRLDASQFTSVVIGCDVLLPLCAPSEMAHRNGRCPEIRRLRRACCRTGRNPGSAGLWPPSWRRTGRRFHSRGYSRQLRPLTVWVPSNDVSQPYGPKPWMIGSPDSFELSFHLPPTRSGTFATTVESVWRPEHTLSGSQRCRT